MIRVFVIHRTELICNIIVSVLSDEKDIYVVGKANELNEDTIERIRISQCNMVLVAANLPNNGALTLTERLAEEELPVNVLVIGVPESKSIILQYVFAGASGYVLEDVPVDQLLENIRAVHEEKAIVSPEIAGALMSNVAKLAKISVQNEINPSAVEELTPRERDVLNLIGEGLTNQEIGDRLYIEVGTVKNHVHNILKKLEVSSRDEAASYLPYLEEDEE